MASIIGDNTSDSSRFSFSVRHSSWGMDFIRKNKGSIIFKIEFGEEEAIIRMVSEKCLSDDSNNEVSFSRDTMITIEKR